MCIAQEQASKNKFKFSDPASRPAQISCLGVKPPDLAIHHQVKRFTIQIQMANLLTEWFESLFSTTLTTLTGI